MHFSRKRTLTAALGLAGLALGLGVAPALASPAAPAHTAVAGHAIHYMSPHAANRTAAAALAAAAPLTFHGGTMGIDPSPKVYLIYWGSQWNSDTRGVQDYMQRFMQGLGTSADTWSPVNSQYCQGVPSGTVNCGSAGVHPTFSGSVYAGTWLDTSTAAPAQASDGDLANEAIRAAAHFGNTTQAPNLNAQYVVMSPTGTNPGGGFGPTYCAWHSSTSSAYGTLAFTNMPYVSDKGCGTNMVNSGAAGALDGFSIVEGHEFAETVTDFAPESGWADSAGQENGDKCAWQGLGNITLPTGTFAMQPTWSNQTGACAMSAPTGGSETVTVASPGAQTSTAGSAVSLRITASDSQNKALTYSATGLPAGLSISSSGLITGTPSAAGTSSVTVTATSGTASGSTSFSWTVNPVVTGGITNGTFESGSLTGWTSSGTTAVSNSGAHSGTYSAMVGSTSPSNTSSIAQTFTAPTGTSNLSFWYNATCPDTVTYDWATATLKDNTTGITTTPLAKTCVNPSSGWKQVTSTVTAGHSYTLTLTSKDDNYPGDPTYTKYDDVALS